MEPRLKPKKIWKYRIIVCDQDGNYEFDDCMNRECIEGMSRLLMGWLIEREKNE